MGQPGKSSLCSAPKCPAIPALGRWRPEDAGCSLPSQPSLPLSFSFMRDQSQNTSNSGRHACAHTHTLAYTRRGWRRLVSCSIGLSYPLNTEPLTEPPAHWSSATQAAANPEESPLLADVSGHDQFFTWMLGIQMQALMTHRCWESKCRLL